MKLIKNIILLIILSFTSLTANFIGAGILPYSIDQEQYLFLLGKDAEREKWTDFGGGRKNDETPEQTAARECEEETIKVLGSADTISKSLEESTTYLIKSEAEKPYYQYLIKIDFISPQRFLDKRFNTENLSLVSQEKIDFTWIKAKDLFEAIKNNSLDTKNYLGEEITLFKPFLQTLKNNTNFIEQTFRTKTNTID